MNRLVARIIGVSALLVSVGACAQGLNCEMDNASLQAMGEVKVSFKRTDGTKFDVTARLADNNQTRAAGFQRICESAIEDKPIFFLYSYKLTPRFHMRNVVAPIDIAFIDEDGVIESIQSMQPYVLGSKNQPTYGPTRPIVGVLEGHKGFYTKHRIDSNTSVSWQVLSEQPAATN